jgi:hypothetical protein
MAQFRRPNADDSLGGWQDEAGGSTTIYQSIDESSASDADFVRSPNNPDASEIYNYSLSGGATPAGGTRTFRYRYAKSASGGRQIDLTVRLRQGTTILHTYTHTDISDTFTTAEQVVTAGITDYSDLNVQVWAVDVGGGGGRRAYISWSELELPDAVGGAIWTRTNQDIFTFTENLKSVEVFTARISDSFTFVDNLFEFINPEVKQRVLQDSFTFSDNAAARKPLPYIVQTGSGTFTDQTARDVHDERELQDSSTFSDQVTYSVFDASTGELLTRAVDELFPPFDDQITRTVIRSYALQDSFSFSDQIETVHWDVRQQTVAGGTFADSELRDVHDEREVQDELVFAEQLNYTIAPASGKQEIAPQDAFSFADNLETADIFGRLLQQEIPGGVTQESSGLILEDDFQSRSVGTTIGGGWVEVNKDWTIDDDAGNKRVRTDDADGTDHATLQWQTQNVDDCFMQSQMAVSPNGVHGMLLRWKGALATSDRNGYIFALRRLQANLGLDEYTANVSTPQTPTAATISGNLTHAQAYAADGVQEMWYENGDVTHAAADTAHDGNNTDRYIGLNAATVTVNNQILIADNVIVCESKNIAVTGLLPGYKAKVINASASVVASATESSGTATVDCSRYTEEQVAGTGATEVVPLGGWPTLRITNSSDVAVATYTGSVYPGDAYNFVTFVDQITHNKISGYLAQDDLDFVENLQTADVFTRRHSDSFTFTDQIRRGVFKEPHQLQDTFTFSDQIRRDQYLTRLLDEFFNFAEKGNRIPQTGGGVTQTVLLQDILRDEDFPLVEVIVFDLCSADPWTKRPEKAKAWGRTCGDKADKTWAKETEEDSPWTEMVKDEDCGGGVDFIPPGPERKP